MQDYGPFLQLWEVGGGIPQTSRREGEERGLRTFDDRQEVVCFEGLNLKEGY